MTNLEVHFEELVRPKFYVGAIHAEGKLPVVHLTLEDVGSVILLKGEIVHYAYEIALNR